MRLRFVVPILAVVTLAISALAYPLLPVRVPIHWDARGVVNGYGSRTFACLFTPLLVIGLGLLFMVINRFAPRLRVGADAAHDDGGSNERIMVVPLFFTAFTHLVVMLYAANVIRDTPRMIALGLAGMMLLMGNVMGKVRPSWFVGVRTPWTLASPQNWRATHRLAAALMVGGGIVCLPIVLAFPSAVAIWAAAGLLTVTLLLPVGYSYWLHRNGAG